MLRKNRHILVPQLDSLDERVMPSPMTVAAALRPRRPAAFRFNRAARGPAFRAAIQRIRFQNLALNSNFRAAQRAAAVMVTTPAIANPAATGATPATTAAAGPQALAPGATGSTGSGFYVPTPISDPFNPTVPTVEGGVTTTGSTTTGSRGSIFYVPTPISDPFNPNVPTQEGGFIAPGRVLPGGQVAGGSAPASPGTAVNN